MYGPECWALNIRDEIIMELAEMRMLMRIRIGTECISRKNNKLIIK